MKNAVILAVVLASASAFAKPQSPGLDSVLFACADDKNRAVTVELAGTSEQYVATVQLGAAIEVDHRPIGRVPAIASQVTFAGETLEISFPTMQPDYIAPAYTHAAGTIKVNGFDDKEVNLFCWRGPLFKDTLPR
jgi:hypothetical protein